MTTGAADEPGRASPQRALAEIARVAGGKTITVGSLVLCNLVVARASESAAEYGLYASGIALALILDAVIGFPLDISTVRFAALHASELDRTAQLHAAVFRVKLLAGGALLAVVATLNIPLSTLLFGAESGGVLALAVLVAVALLMVRSTSVLLQVRGEFTLYAALDTLQGVLRLALVTATAALPVHSAETFLAAYALGTGLAFALGLRLVSQRYIAESWPTLSELREAAAHAGLATVIVVLGTLTGRADVPVVAWKISAEEAGHYAVALQVATLLTLLASYGSVVMQPRIIAMSRERRIGTLVRWNIVVAGCITVALVPLLWALPHVIPALFGPRYMAAVRLSAVLLIGTCADLFSMPVLMMVAIQMWPRLMLVGELLIAVAFFGILMSGAAATSLTIAWVVTAVRFAKLALYAVITALHLNGQSEADHSHQRVTAN